jgi:predicted transcriptional regulator
MTKNPPAMPAAGSQNLPKPHRGSVNAPPIKQPYFSVGQVAEALAKCGGRRTEVARLLGCGSSTVSDYIKRHPQLQELDREILAARLDMCRKVVDVHVESCNLTAAIFQLRTLGGYSERTELTTPAGQPLQIALNPAHAAVL